VEVLYANRSAAHWVHRDSRVWSSFKAHARDIFDPPFTRSNKDRAHPSSRNSSSEFLRSCTSPFTLRCSASPALGFRSLFATSLKSGYVCSRSLPRSTSFRPQVFATSRRLLPLSSLQAYSIPQPRPGSIFRSGASLPAQPIFLIGRFASSLPLLHRRSYPRSDFRRLTCTSTNDASRLRGLAPRQAAFLRSGYSPRQRPLPSSNFMLLQVPALSTPAPALTVAVRS